MICPHCHKRIEKPKRSRVKKRVFELSPTPEDGRWNYRRCYFGPGWKLTTKKRFDWQCDPVMINIEKPVRNHYGRWSYRDTRGRVWLLEDLIPIGDSVI